MGHAVHDRTQITKGCNIYLGREGGGCGVPRERERAGSGAG